jgi:hypothetical protein
MQLYHGSINRLTIPNLSKCRNETDFGKGFYTTTSFEQARKWALIKKERNGSDKAFVSVYEIDDTIINDIKFIVLHFGGATKHWLEFVVLNRKGLETEKFDLVMGPVANDKLYATLLLFEQGILTVEATIEQLKTHVLFNQLSFHSPKALNELRLISCEEVTK